MRLFNIESEPIPLAVLGSKGLQKLYIDDDVFDIIDHGRTVEIKQAEQCWRWFIARKKYTLSLSARPSFLDGRKNAVNEDPKVAYQRAKQNRTVIGLVPLDDSGMPVPPKRGKIFATLPTGVDYGFGMHLQGPWLLNADRQDLISLFDSTWQVEIIEKLPRTTWGVC